MCSIKCIQIRQAGENAQDSILTWHIADIFTTAWMLPVYDLYDITSDILWRHVHWKKNRVMSCIHMNKLIIFVHAQYFQIKQAYSLSKRLAT